MDIDVQHNTFDSEQNVLDTVEGEVSFFRALMHARPVGIHRFFHAMSMQHLIEKGVGHEVPIEDIWKKLETCYNLEQLEALEGDYEPNGSNSSTPEQRSSPSLGDEDLISHPFFREEFALPQDLYTEALMGPRRMRTSPSPPTESAPTSPEPRARRNAARGRGHKRQKPSKVELAGLVSESDSSALTSESADEAEDASGQSPSDRRASVATGTDAGDEEMQDDEGGVASPEDASASGKSRRGRKPVPSGRARAASSAARVTRKRKK